MALFDELYTASYKGIPFIVDSSNVDGGQKTAIHEFINSNVQSVEDLGLRPRTYTVQAIIIDPTAAGNDSILAQIRAGGLLSTIFGNSSYLVIRDRFLQALEEGGKGVLVHPFFGRLENMKVTSFRLTESTSSLGQAQFSIVFQSSDTDGLPVASTNSISLLSQISTDLFGDITEDITNLFNVTSEFAGNFDAAVQKVDAIVDAFSINSRSLATLPAKINDFNSLLGGLATNVNSLITQPAELAQTINDLFTEFPGLYESATDQTNALSLFFTFGDDDVAISQTTAGLTERAQNNDVLNGAMKTYALSQAYVSAAQIDFTTVDEINSVSNTLEETFKSVKSLVGLG